VTSAYPFALQFAAHKMLGLASTSKTSRLLEFFSPAPAIRADASCSRLHESHGCRKNRTENNWLALPKYSGRTFCSRGTREVDCRKRLNGWRAQGTKISSHLEALEVEAKPSNLCAANCSAKG